MEQANPSIETQGILMPAPPGPNQVMQAQPQAQGNQATPLVAPVAPPPAFTLSPKRDNQVLDFTDVRARKHYGNVIALFDEKFDGSHETLWSSCQELLNESEIWDGHKSCPSMWD